MEKIVFECESITPMFMYGADGKTPELRPASIKGVMRFWWRAIHGNSNIKELKEAESNIFGSTGRRSRVNIRVQYKSIENNVDKNKNNVVKIEKIEKIPYLFYPFYLDGAEKEKKCFLNFKFKVILSSCDKKALKEACYSFTLLSLFGGLGSRSRRGGGNFVITNISDTNYHQFLLQNTDNLKSIYEEIQEYFSETYKIDKVTDEYSTLNIENFKLSKAKTSWSEALKEIGKKYSSFRKKKENKLLKNASFGLPIVFENTIEVVTKPEYERRASPMIIKILKVQNKYYLLVLKLNGEFLPEGTKIKEKKDDLYKDIDKNSVDDFMKELRK